MCKRLAEEIKTRVEAIITAAIAARSIGNDTADWLHKIGDALHAKFAKAGLVEPRTPEVPVKHATLGEFVEEYIKRRTDVAPYNAKPASLQGPARGVLRGREGSTGLHSSGRR